MVLLDLQHNPSPGDGARIVLDTSTCWLLGPEDLISKLNSSCGLLYLSYSTGMVPDGHSKGFGVAEMTKQR